MGLLKNVKSLFIKEDNSQKLENLDAQQFFPNKTQK